jgi:gamma-glutamylaminecyclotransferase
MKVNNSGKVLEFKAKDEDEVVEETIVIGDTPQCVPPDTEVPLVFVYGTLKRGHGNHRLLRDSEFIQRLSLASQFYMINMGGFPAIICDNDILNPHKPKTFKPTGVIGELYRVPASDMKYLDALEGHPEFYTRDILNVYGLKEQAWYYKLPPHYLLDRTTHRPHPNINSLLMPEGVWHPDEDESKWLEARKSR